MISIREWMNDKTILITGGAGFMGKVLVEKLLRSCPGVKRIYLIMRPKRGQAPQERWTEIVKDEELKNNVNIIFHSAATVRFNDPLHKAILTNTRGTLEMCKLASEMGNLEVFVHVSTAFCNTNLKKSYYEEKIYEPCQDWRTILKIFEEEDAAVVNTISYKIIQDHPNTYTFTKSLSEKIVEEYSSKFPTVIARPSIVTVTFLDPISGWTDNLNGLLGMTTGVSKGVLRVFKTRKDTTLDFVPVDMAINALIISAWEKANSENKELSIYNCAYGDYHPLSIHEILKQGLDMNEKECTLDNDIWYPFCILVSNDLYFHILFYLLQVIHAIFIDSILYLMKKKTRLVKINIKIYLAIHALEAFTMKSTNFNNITYRSLWDKLSEAEAEIFLVRPTFKINPRQFMVILQKGVKKHFLKENLEEEEYHKLKLKRLYYLDRVVRGILISAVLVTIYKFINKAINYYIL